MRLLLLLLLPLATLAQPRTDAELRSILSANTHPLFREILDNPSTYRLQIIYTRIDRDRQNRPLFRHYYFHHDPSLYFNPASMVKLPLAILALEKLATLPGVGRNTALLFDSSRPWHRPLLTDTTASSGRPSIGHLIKRALLISENDPYNRLYQFLGQGPLNRRLHALGYTDARITRQFMGLSPEENRHTPPLRFIDASGATILSLPEASNRDSFRFPAPILLGKAHLDRRDSLIHAPFDFTKQNNLSLQSLQQQLQALLFPQAVPRRQRFRLKEDDYTFLYRYLSQYPSETPEPRYDTSRFRDSYVKFFFRDSTGRMPAGVRVFNKVGWAYGFLTDVSYVADFTNGVEYMLAATLYVNSDEVLNDGRYDYVSKGWPFLYQLGQTIYRYELRRPRLRKPDLSRFRIPYEQRNPADRRPQLREVDN
jgi:hypothetical protein